MFTVKSKNINIWRTSPSKGNRNCNDPEVSIYSLCSVYVGNVARVQVKKRKKSECDEVINGQILYGLIAHYYY